MTADQRTVPLSEPIVLAPGERRLEVRYTANTFVRPEGACFRHRLVGFDDDWVEAGSVRFAQYSHVPPGRYVLTILAANSDGVWNTEGLSLAVLVLPAVYQTWWFRLLIAIGAAGLVAMSWLRREAALKRAHTEQQAFSRQLIASQEAERKRIAAELHDSLGQRLVIIKNLAMLANRPESTGARERVDEIAAEASSAIGEVREIAQNLRPHHLDRLGLTKSLATLVRQAADASTISIAADLDPIDGVFPKETEIHVYRVIQESLNNLLKHSHATRAAVAIRRSPQQVVVTVSDNGTGFHAAASGDLRAAGSGFGLTGIAERVTLLGGHTEIRSVPGKGTTVTINFDPRRLRTT